MKRPMTPRGYSALRGELQKLKAQRPEIAAAIEVARALGDLSENADYTAWKEKSGLVEAKIRDIESKLAHAQIIDLRSRPEPEKVTFGVRVTIEDLDSGEKKVLSIVGSDESDITRGMISIDSPLAKSLIGKASGDTAQCQSPSGMREYEVVEISIDATLFVEEL